MKLSVCHLPSWRYNVMKYYSGLLALSQYACEEDDSTGLGVDADKYLEDPEKFERDTDYALLKDVEVFETIIIPTGELKRCASHVRAYCDLLVEHDFDTLRDIYEVAIRSYNVLNRIFLMARTYGLLKDKDIVGFLNDEFGSYFRGHLVINGNDELLASLLEED